VILPVHDRTEWQTAGEPVTGPGALPAQWQAVVYHYPGSSATPPLTLNGLFALCRSMQHSYLTDPNRGYSLGYNYVVGFNGELVEVRGLDIRNAANNGVPSKSGVQNYNGYTVSVQFVVKGDAPATSAQLNAAAWLHVNVIEPHVGRVLRVEGHGTKDATPCPGAGIIGQLPTLADLIDDARTPDDDEEDDMPKSRVIAASDPKNESEKAWFILSPSSIAWCRTASQLLNGQRDGWYLNTNGLPTQEYTVQQIREMCDAMLVGARPPGF
jgi:hypothetical protein